MAPSEAPARRGGDETAVIPRVIPPHLNLHQERESILQGKPKLHLLLLIIGCFSVVGLAIFAATGAKRKVTLIPHLRTPAVKTVIAGGSSAATSGHAQTTFSSAEAELTNDTMRKVGFRAHSYRRLRVPRDNSSADIAASIARSQPIWCFYESEDHHFTVDSLPFELCNAIVFCCFALRPDGSRLVPSEQDRLTLLGKRRRPSQAFRLFLGIASPTETTGFESLAARAHDNVTVFQMCHHLLEHARRFRLQGILFQPPDETPVSFHLFLFKLHGCLASFDIELTTILPEAIIDDNAFTTYEDYFKYFENVIIWGHTPSMGYATCPFDKAALPWLRWLERRSAAVRKKAVLSISVGPLRYKSQLQHGTLGPACFGQQAKEPPRRVSYAQLCQKIFESANEESVVGSGCHVYRKGESCYLVLSVKALATMEEVHQQFKHGVAILDLNLDDYSGVCGEKYRVFNVLFNMLNHDN
ncbi:uncharacterized protein LOC135398092 [Ornithodoros turicata]|uniref:uncharacterized protein LOC135398092 n=1 Tax=Ornithodoros turicata TaxID=34597 RepID=UPI003139377C